MPLASCPALPGRSSLPRTTRAARSSPPSGRGPLEYLARWRIELAAQRLRKDDAALAAIAHSVGYGSGSALGIAFERVLGVPPGDYRRRPAAGTDRDRATCTARSG
ncbi:helix-turn-helix domain-containing protein [Streptomyces sp. NPDC002669]|uniref:helix-turn-helix domain-containing protein n=1 Tax=Streptomyces sp. NPDC002669 TaxID=3364658 RepID=UPI0036792815